MDSMDNMDKTMMAPQDLAAEEAMFSGNPPDGELDEEWIWDPYWER